MHKQICTNRCTDARTDECLHAHAHAHAHARTDLQQPDCKAVRANCILVEDDNKSSKDAEQCREMRRLCSKVGDSRLNTLLNNCVFNGSAFVRMFDTL